MKRSIIVLLSIMFFIGTSSLYAQLQLPEPELPTSTAAAEAVPDSEWIASSTADGEELISLIMAMESFEPAESLSLYSIATLAQAATSDAGPWSADTSAEVPTALVNNQYYLESLRYKNLADEAFDYGDYDAAAGYAAEALRYAQLSDEYIAEQMAARDAEKAIAAASKRLEWAVSVGADKTYPAEYAEADDAYGVAVNAYSAKDYDAAIVAAQRVLAALASVEEIAPLPAQYTVRTWAENRDCFWNISGYPFVYGDPTKWRILYQANKAKLRQPENPDLIHPGIVLDIPSINGERRAGMWVSGRAYAPLPRK